MSAYIVEDATLHRIITFLNLNRDMDWAFKHHLGPLGYDRSQSESLDRLAGEMHLLNCDAVDDRYGKGTAASDTADVATLPKWKLAPCSALQAYKALQCFLYQCSEGDTPKRPLFLALREIQHALANDIITALPQYDAAKWG